MTPPRVCPPPPDCPLYEQRLSYQVDEPLRRAVLIERKRASSLASVIRAEIAGGSRANDRAPILLPAPKPFSPLPVPTHTKGEVG
jgi:hypothetical protein